MTRKSCFQAVDPDFESLVVGEELRERFFDGVAPLEMAARQIGVVAIGHPEGGHRLGVPFLERLDERFPNLLKRGLFSRLVGLSRPNE